MGVKYQPYLEYNESGVQMLGVLPVDWETKQVRYLLKDGAEGIKIGPFGSALKLEDMVENGIRVYGQENVIKKDFSLGKRRISKDKFQEMKVYQVYPDDLLITMMGTSGKCELVPQDADVGIIDSHLLRMRVKESEILPRYFRLLIDECYEIENQIKISGKGSIMHGLNSSIVKSLTLPLPSTSEQEGILNFLDYETAKIDTLIDKQQQLIQLLKEKRQAVISHAVTKGLNPSAPMRDSGVEWLGEVPEHWKVSKVKFEYKNLDGRRIPLSTEERSYRQGDYPYYGASGIIDHVDDYIFDEGLVLVSEDGANLLARSSKIAFPAYGKYWVNNHAHILRPKDENIDYWSEVIEVRDLTPYISGAAQPKFTSEALSNLVIAVPTSADEINQIAEYIREKKEKYSNLINKADKSIQLMQERRTALISAAVTGKIDVRHHASPPAGNDTNGVSA